MSGIAAATTSLLYDWHGWNTAIFLWVNGIHAPVYDELMVFASFFGAWQRLPFYLLAIVFYAAGRALALPQAERPSFLRGWALQAAVIIGAFIAYAVPVYALKHGLDMPRPFAALPWDSLHLPGPPLPPEKFFQSFPSGHAAFSTMMVAALWPKIWSFLKPVALACVLLVMWSRLALGVHFPADVLAGAAIALSCTMIVRRIVYRMFARSPA